MSLATDDGLVSISDDELIEVQVTRASSTTSNRPAAPGSIFDNILNPRGITSRARATMESLGFPMAGSSNSRRPSQSHVRLRPPHTQSTLPRSWTTTPDSTVIDLTAEPDSPVERRRTQPTQTTQQQPYMPARNPRRTNSQRISPPQLSRSDSTFVGQQPSFIDLTEDSPEDEQRPSRNAWRPQPPQPQRIHRQHRRHHHRGHDHTTQEHLLALGYMPHGQDFGIESFRRLAGLITGDMSLPNSFNSAHIPSSSSSQQQQEPPKPPLEPLPPAKPGFTRDTCTDADSEQVVICPACNEELAYDPADSPATPSKKRKRVAGEHHFWALKKCGHVYCSDCFENRRPTKSTPDGVGFPFLNKEAAGPNDIRCAVEGCETKVASKTEWVGIYL
ncbi:uncharacterized protein TrAFT101_011807 [Trichoderma asperellum]|uniref:Uncharacterized protein n=1 Tax=Trichoderma asperellum (strain ATCC 204424 / CBS 433.97 / NBRC 101777) TaxID=1042311 RepID=A0A2T3YZU8_TRIA4|nr:hypothetical protein M441DRAFT_71558 [Trichoderma asperellum CBS 433.97]PTB38088.1 hypothetical protein M441DRAFT_71558 [Trichoderma asperellum CBS 433.97]UKZ97038.1 hypothetical protein TrAFT101_011807 [Trichoderma asperellum]